MEHTHHAQTPHQLSFLNLSFSSRESLPWLKSQTENIHRIDREMTARTHLRKLAQNEWRIILLLHFASN